MRAQGEAAGRRKAMVGSSTVECRGDADALSPQRHPASSAHMRSTPEIGERMLSISDLDPPD